MVTESSGDPRENPRKPDFGSNHTNFAISLVSKPMRDEAMVMRRFVYEGLTQYSRSIAFAVDLNPTSKSNTSMVSFGMGVNFLDRDIQDESGHRLPLYVRLTEEGVVNRTLIMVDSTAVMLWWRFELKRKNTTSFNIPSQKPEADPKDIISFFNVPEHNPDEEATLLVASGKRSPENTLLFSTITADYNICPRDTLRLHWTFGDYALSIHNRAGEEVGCMYVDDIDYKDFDGPLTSYSSRSSHVSRMLPSRLHYSDISGGANHRSRVRARKEGRKYGRPLGYFNGMWVSTWILL
ncbi:hypothetical protein K432DRAFT_401783 [Lepidopterella palustris CBS 459.81]|uniref:Uncharacterized protein n=1 Tax=Lepidopterella palustris CBS 459.81 TaxID=1314670 RepID=A0A8E2JIW4_9PEZI|nr:hypothetical protein K432DRAFT_401783 [Lepidopterella palustris CBS 459.81]